MRALGAAAARARADAREFGDAAAVEHEGVGVAAEARGEPGPRLAVDRQSGRGEGVDGGVERGARHVVARADGARLAGADRRRRRGWRPRRRAVPPAVGRREDLDRDLDLPIGPALVASRDDPADAARRRARQHFVQLDPFDQRRRSREAQARVARQPLSQQHRQPSLKEVERALTALVHERDHGEAIARRPLGHGAGAERRHQQKRHDAQKPDKRRGRAPQ